MAVEVMVVLKLDEQWASEAELAEMSDDYVISLVRDEGPDVLLGDGTWTVRRNVCSSNASS